MIQFLQTFNQKLEDSKIDSENKHLLSTDLTGYTVLIFLKNKAEGLNSIIPKELHHINEDYLDLWKDTADGGSTLNCILIERLTGSSHGPNAYTAVITNGIKIDRWAIVKIGTFDFDMTKYSLTVNEIDRKDSFEIDFFGFHPYRVRSEENDFFESSDFTLRILKRVSTSEVDRLRYMFYNGETIEPYRYKIIREQLGERSAYLRTRIHECRTIRYFRDEEYSISAYWQECEFKQELKNVNRLMYSRFSNAQIDLEELWFQKIKHFIGNEVSLLSSKDIAVLRLDWKWQSGDEGLCTLENKVYANTIIKPNDFFVTIQEPTLHQFELTLYRCVESLGELDWPELQIISHTALHKYCNQIDSLLIPVGTKPFSLPISEEEKAVERKKTEQTQEIQKAQRKHRVSILLLNISTIAFAGLVIGSIISFILGQIRVGIFLGVFPAGALVFSLLFGTIILPIWTWIALKPIKPLMEKIRNEYKDKKQSLKAEYIQLIQESGISNDRLRAITQDFDSRLERVGEGIRESIKKIETMYPGRATFELQTLGNILSRDYEFFPNLQREYLPENDEDKKLE